MTSACSDATIRIWNIRTDECEQVIQGSNFGLSVDWNPVDDLLAIAYMEQPVQIWDTQNHAVVQALNSRLPYEGMNITGVTGISEGQKDNLKALGAIEAYV